MFVTLKEHASFPEYFSYFHFLNSSRVHFTKYYYKRHVFTTLCNSAFLYLRRPLSLPYLEALTHYRLMGAQ